MTVFVSASSVREGGLTIGSSVSPKNCHIRLVRLFCGASVSSRTRNACGVFEVFLAGEVVVENWLLRAVSHPACDFDVAAVGL